MLEVEHQLRHELQRYSSLIHTLRSTDYDRGSWILGQLRRGAYDGILLGAGREQTYPWEDVSWGRNSELQSANLVSSMQFFETVLDRPSSNADTRTDPRHAGG